MSNLQEFENGTDPKNWDSDGDLLPDEWEIENGLDPTDTAGDNGADGDADNDGLNNLQELIHGTDPLNSDTDGDEVKDGNEVNQGSAPTDASDGGQAPPADQIVEVPFTVGDPSGSHSERWKMNIQGNGPDNHRQFGFVSPDFGQMSPPTNFKLCRGNDYTITLSHEATNREDGPDYDWQAQVEGKPGTSVLPGDSTHSGANRFTVVGDAWILDNEDGLMGTVDQSFDDSNNAAGKSARLRKMDLVPDWDRDGVIDDSDRGQVTEDNPFRFWINDDDDSGEWGTDDVPNQGSNADGANAQVDGLRDLVDFFPLFFDLEELLSNFDDLSTVDLKLSGSSLRFIQFPDQFGGIDPSDSRKYLSDLTFARDDNNLAEAATVEIGDSSNPTSLGSEFVDLAAQGKGVLLLEGVNASAPTNPLTLHFFVDGNEVFTYEFPLKLSPVEEMFRHVDLRDEVTEYDGTATTEAASPNGTQTGDPGDAYPDTLTNGKYFVMVHGCCTDEQEARGTQSEIFKRMHQFGSKARYVGVVWDGEESNDYHKEVFQAFQTGDELAGALSFASGDVTVAAHSLGNIVVSHAIQSGNFLPSRYYMVNAAVASEAYSFTSVEQDMVEEDWKNIPHRLNAGEWHKVFEGTSDARKDLRWRNFFAGVLQATTVINFYSLGDETLAKMPGIDEESVLSRVWTWRWKFARGAWKAQELVKGKNFLSTQGVSLLLDRTQSGWNRNVTAYLPGFTNWDNVTDEEIKTTPVFDRFMESKLTDENESVASAEAAKEHVQYDLLARAIPALSYSIAVDPLNSVDSDDFDMGNHGRAPTLNGNWPEEGHDGESAGDWLHGDFRNNAIHFVYPMYEEMINRGTLDEN